MILRSSATRVFLVAGATDLRKGFDGLYGVVEGVLKADPLSGHLFVFCNRAGNRIKVLYWDGSGLWVCTKRLEHGRYSWPDAKVVDQGAGVELSGDELMLLLGGIDLCQTRMRRWYRRKALG